MREALREEESALGSWPRRLLHVPSLTSYKWQPGNVYGDYASPSYNALTYTWGRWKLHKGEIADVEALPIKGVSWPIPRIDPQHFTLAQFERVLHSTIKLQPRWLTRKHTPAVEFLWLDVACIDQTVGSVTGAAEVGRQAVIFEGAQTVFAWLSQHEHSTLSDMILRLDSMADVDVRRRTDISGEHAEEAFSLFGYLLDDPWWSSTWTLQESYLRQDAYILSKEAELVSLPYSSEGDVTLLDLFDLGMSFSRASQERLLRNQIISATDLSNSIYTHLHQRITSSGLAALATTSPMSVYGAAGYRRAEDMNDRIYGIQQIFKFRLGKSSLDADPTPIFSLAELEDQLGQEMLKRYPTMSQLHTYTEPARFGKGWLIDQKSKVPEDSAISYHWPSGLRGQSSCRFETREVSKNLWGYFKGLVCAFGDLEASCLRVDNQDQVSHWSVDNSTLNIYPDTTVELQGSPAYHETGTHIPGGEPQREYARWLTQSFQNDRSLVVLLLGQNVMDHAPYSSYQIGLVLLRRDLQGIPHWHRVGLCAWNEGYLTIGTVDSLEKPFLQGEGSGWQLSSGIFG